LTVEGTPAADAGRAVWVQAGIFFVDVRGPGGFACDTSFAGSTKWLAPYLEWQHDVDRADDHDGADRGHITFDCDDLIEEGGFIAGEHRQYRERWRRLPGAPAPLLAASGPGGVAVRIGEHAAAVVDARERGGGFAARYEHLGPAGWETELAIDDGPAVSLPATLDAGAALPDGWSWRTNEA
jgi:hypothetical protein